MALKIVSYIILFRIEGARIPLHNIEMIVVPLLVEAAVVVILRFVPVAVSVVAVDLVGGSIVIAAGVSILGGLKSEGCSTCRETPLAPQKPKLCALRDTAFTTFWQGLPVSTNRA